MKNFSKVLIVIPHHDRHDLLKKCLGKLKGFNVVVVSGGSFAENCNKGAKLAEDNIIFLNDDTLPKPELLKEMCKRKEDIIGINQLTDGEVWKGAKIFRSEKLFPMLSKEKTDIPLGHCFRIKKKVWDALGGFDERFVNGFEDVDLFLRAMISDYSIGHIDKHIIHYQSQSYGRHDNEDKNFNLFNKIWSKKL